MKIVKEMVHTNCGLFFELLLLLTTFYCCLARGALVTSNQQHQQLQGDVRKLFCRETKDGEKAFYVPNHGFEKCNLDSCPLTERSRFGVDYCFMCCWASITG